MNVIDEKTLENQIPEAENTSNVSSKPEITGMVQPEKPAQTEQPSSMIGQKLSISPHDHGLSEEEHKEINKKFGEARLGDTLQHTNEIREGWIPVDEKLLGDRMKFYPKDWKFRIRPATVEAIRNWSTIDDQNIISVDDAFNEVLKSCLSISTPQGPLPWGNVRSWDRFFFVLLIREYTFIQGERKMEYDEDCPNCDNPVKFNLTSNSLMYDMPDEDITSRYFDTETQTWIIDPEEYDLPMTDPIVFYLPTLDKDAAIKQWLITRAQEKKKVDNVFMKFLPWMAPKISKDETIAARQIREYELKYKNWDTETFAFMNEVINNIQVMPLSKLKTVCPICGEEVTADVRFPNGINALFTISSGRKKFGKK